VPIVRGTVDVVDARHERGADFYEGGLSRKFFHADRRRTPFEPLGNDDGERRGGCSGEARDLGAETNLRHDRIDGKAFALERDTATLDRPQWADRGNAACGGRHASARSSSFVTPLTRAGH
jgi:hypothetical protein